MTHTNISRALRSLDSREEEPCSGWREACSGVAVGAREHIGHSDSGVESQGLQRTSWGGAVSLQILKQDIKLWSLLCVCVYIYSFSYSFPLSQDIRYSDLCYRVGPCLSILCIIVCIC